MGKEGKGGREEWKREGRNDRRRRLKVGKGKKEKEREWKGREGKRSVPSLKVFRHLRGYTNTRPFRQYPGV
jgi:hypothetical protein